jgi:adenosylhomocysteine nucleosidase
MERKKFENHTKKLSPIFVVLFLFVISFPASAAVIGWFYALDADKVAFESVAGIPTRTVTLMGGTVMSEYRLGPHRVVAAKMGSGCVVTAVTVSRVMTLNPFDRLVSTGPAGGIGENIKLGTWHRAEQVIGWQKGKIGEGGRTFLPETDTNQMLTKLDEWPTGRWSDLPGVRLLSGEAFIASTEKRMELTKEHHAHIVEMNSLGILANLRNTQVKCLILRVVSDYANEQASEDFSAFLKSYQGEGGMMVAELVKALPIGRDEPAAHEALLKLIKE